MTKISVVINTRNEEENLPKALKSIKSFADEIVIVDMESTDSTVDIAKKAKAKVYSHKPTGYVEPARNFAISKATGDWILLLDADEEIPTTLANKLKEIVDRDEADYYRIPRKNIIFGKWMQHSRWWPDYIIRFFKKGKVEWSEIIHTVPTTTGRGIDLEDKENYAIIHHHYQSIDQFVSRLNNYTSRQVDVVLSSGYKFDWKDLIKKPTNEFLSRYFFGKGYKDGIHGLAAALLQAFSETILYLKIWEREKFKEQEISLKESIRTMRETQKDVNYWHADSLVKEHGGILNRVKRKFKLH
jgi:(heptosyl)LPS beta-1,4-glucosyltransferase